MRIGVDLGGTKIEAIAIDRDGRTLHRRRVPTPAGDYDGTVRAITDLVCAVEHATGDTGTIGIGTPGAISPASGLIKNANSVVINGRALDRDLESALGRPIRMANDADCFALSEAADGAAAGASVVFGAILGTGVGGGIVVDGRPLIGANAIGGEWGHNPLPWPRDEERPGPECYCGRRGCIETFCSGPGLRRDHVERGGDPDATAERIVDLAAAGDADAVAALERYEHRLARALATVVNLLDPDVVVLGGGLSNVERLYENVPRCWARWIFSDAVTTPLRRATHGDSSGVRGAARLWDAPTARP